MGPTHLNGILLCLGYQWCCFVSSRFQCLDHPSAAKSGDDLRHFSMQPRRVRLGVCWCVHLPSFWKESPLNKRYLNCKIFPPSTKILVYSSWYCVIPTVVELKHRVQYELVHCFDAKYDLSVEVSDSQQKCLSNLKKALRTGEYYDEDEEFDPMRCQSDGWSESQSWSRCL